ncbi:alpha/beta hydrolase [Roseibacterium sp. SDUM158017]|uniref:alpha/beta hydrolase n=1 Tax=Roseicyclus salinarum TaxID=3036773 RepID=UPI0024157200|nr:alpha/beta hydrolase [Roseibacterium sp. SDUM158017]MDG4648592.1 alpha/beta hydrolase [Roseibacterium sp. SDUM158017]
MIDWTDAFDNSSYVPGSAELPALWARRASEYRAALAAKGLEEQGLPYGPHERQAFDLFHPGGTPEGLVVFVHGGYWQQMDRSDFSHLAEGARARGWAVALPGYRLAPDARIAEITADIAAGIAAAARRVAGPIRLAGHSAGGHLVSRMACVEGPLSQDVAARLVAILSISGIHDLRPLLMSKMNEVLHLTEAEARAESPALLTPRSDLALRFQVGAAERPELLRQTRAIAEAWSLKGGDVADAYLPGEDHFSIIEALADPASDLVAALLG